MTEQEYDTRLKSSLQNRQVEWWKEEPSYLMRILIIDLSD